MNLVEGFKWACLVRFPMREHNRRSFIGKVGKTSVGAGLIGIAGCTSNSGGGGDDSTITMGAAISKSGQLAANGKAFSDGYNTMVKWLNEKKGGLQVGDSTKKIKLIEYDDESKIETTTKLVEKLITEDNVDILLGPYSSGATYAAVPVARKHGQLMIEGAGIADKIFKDYNKKKNWVFGTTPPASRYILGCVRLPAAKGATRVGMFSDQGTFAQGLRSAAKAEIEKQSEMELLVDESIPQDSRDVSSIITKMKNKNVEFAMFNTHLELGTIAHNTARDQQFSPKMIYGGSGTSEPEYWDGVGKDLTGSIFYTTWAPSLKTPGDPALGLGNQLAQETYKRYRKNNAIKGQKLGEWSSRRASGMQVIQCTSHAIQEAGSTKTEDLRQTLNKMDAQGLVAPFKFDDIGRLKGIGYAGQVQSKEEKPIVYPNDVKMSEPIYPDPGWS